jgi:hypothetical protein
MRTARYPELEDALNIWFCEMRGLKLPINDAILKEKAEYYGQMLGSQAKYSNGWLNRFETRFNISSKTLHGEGIFIKCTKC